MKIRIFSTGETMEVNESRARRMTDMGYAELVPEKAKKAVKVEIVDKIPEVEEPAAPETEKPAEKPAKAKKSK